MDIIWIHADICDMLVGIARVIWRCCCWVGWITLRRWGNVADESLAALRHSFVVAHVSPPPLATRVRASWLVRLYTRRNAPYGWFILLCDVSQYQSSAGHFTFSFVASRVKTHIVRHTRACSVHCTVRHTCQLPTGHHKQQV